MQVRGKVIGTGESRDDAAARMMGGAVPVARPVAAKGPGVAEGFWMALGAAPVLLVVLLLASWIEAKVIQREVRQALQEVQRSLR